MVNKKGRVMWVPPVLIDELEDIKREDDLDTHSEAFKKLVKYARVGREAKRIMRLDFSRSIKQIPVDHYPMSRTKKTLMQPGEMY